MELWGNGDQSQQSFVGRLTWNLGKLKISKFIKMIMSSSDDFAPLIKSHASLLPSTSKQVKIWESLKKKSQVL